MPKYFISNTASPTNLKLQSHNAHLHLHLLNRSICNSGFLGPKLIKLCTWSVLELKCQELQGEKLKTVGYHGMVHWQRELVTQPFPLL